MGVFYPRGVAVPKYSFRLINRSTGQYITSGTVSVVISKDGVQAAATNTPVYNGNGEWLLDITAAERDCAKTAILIDHADAVPLNIVITSDQELGPGASLVTLQFGTAGKNASVWLTFASDPTTVVASGTTDSSGNINFYIDADTYYVYFQKAGYNFTNPYTLVVTGAATVSLTVTAATSSLSTTAYASLSVAQAYFDERLHTTAWDNATETDKSKALLMATRAINRLDFQGIATEAAVALKNQFPRGDDTSVPDEIVWATCEEALTLLSRDPEETTESLYVLEEHFSGAKVKYNPDRVPRNVLSGIYSGEAWKYLLLYLRDDRSVNIHRT